MSILCNLKGTEGQDTVRQSVNEPKRIYNAAKKLYTMTVKVQHQICQLLMEESTCSIPILRHNRILTKHCITSGCRTPTQVNTWSNRILPHQVQLSAVQCIAVLSFENKIKNSTNRDGGRWEIEQQRGKEFFLQRRFSQRPRRRYTTSNRASASVHQ